MTKRRPRPTHVYREEVTSKDQKHHTRLTFDDRQFEDWKRLRPLEGAMVEYYSGEIAWEFNSRNVGDA